MSRPALSWVCPSSHGSEVGEQLELGLFVHEPWEGRSPRALTRGHLGVILTDEGEKSTSAPLGPEQLMFAFAVSTRKRSPNNLVVRSPWASPLLPLPWEVTRDD